MGNPDRWNRVEAHELVGFHAKMPGEDGISLVDNDRI